PNNAKAGQIRLARGDHRAILTTADRLAHATLYAERAPLTTAKLVQESDLVLVGQILALKLGIERSHVESGFGNYDWAIDLTIRIQSIEKGQCLIRDCS